MRAKAEDASSTAIKDPDRFYCPFPGCNRSFAELWRLKVHYRAPPDVRGSGKERGHGTELTHCPKCGKGLKPGKHHVGCSATKASSTPRSNGSKRQKLGDDDDDDEDEEEQQHQRQPGMWGPLASTGSVVMPSPMPAGFVMTQMSGPMPMGAAPMAAGGPQPMPGMAMQIPQDPQQAGMYMAAMQANPGMMAAMSQQQQMFFQLQQQGMMPMGQPGMMVPVAQPGMMVPVGQPGMAGPGPAAFMPVAFNQQQFMAHQQAMMLQGQMPQQMMVMHQQQAMMMQNQHQAAQQAHQAAQQQGQVQTQQQQQQAQPPQSRSSQQGQPQQAQTQQAQTQQQQQQQQQQSQQPVQQAQPQQQQQGSKQPQQPSCLQGQLQLPQAQPPPQQGGHHHHSRIELPAVNLGLGVMLPPLSIPSGAEDGDANLKNVFDYDYDLPEHIPSPPPLPPDFHTQASRQATLFNFEQFTKPMPSRSEAAGQGLQATVDLGAGLFPTTSGSLEELDESCVDLALEDKSDHDILHLLFGAPEQLPRMATVHMHKFQDMEAVNDSGGSPGTGALLEPTPTGTGSGGGSGGSPDVLETARSTASVLLVEAAPRARRGQPDAEETLLHLDPELQPGGNTVVPLDGPFLAHRGSSFLMPHRGPFLTDSPMFRLEGEGSELLQKRLGLGQHGSANDLFGLMDSFASGHDLLLPPPERDVDQHKQPDAGACKVEQDLAAGQPQACEGQQQQQQQQQHGLLAKVKVEQLMGGCAGVMQPLSSDGAAIGRLHGNKDWQPGVVARCETDGPQTAMCCPRAVHPLHS